MTIMLTDPNNASYARDPVFPWLLSIKKPLDNKAFGDLNNLLLDCIRTFKHNAQYRNDPRFLKIWLLHLEGSDDTEFVFKEMDENKICSDHSLLYELYAGLLEAKENWQQAHAERSTRSKVVLVRGVMLKYLEHLSIDYNPDDIVALKIKTPAFPWEFYMYRQLDKWISTKQRSSFGVAHGMDVYTDYSLLVCDYLCHGTLHGLCLVDWVKGIDLHLFPDDTEFEGDCRTSGFRCIQMQENKPWRFQVDTYGLCVFVHLMLHSSYMEIEKKATSDGGYIYPPKKPFKRYWNVDLWRELFSQLLNNSPHNDKKLLQNLRERFQDYLCSNRQMLKKLKDLLAKQRLSMCSSLHEFNHSSNYLVVVKCICSSA